MCTLTELTHIGISVLINLLLCLNKIIFCNKILFILFVKISNMWYINCSGGGLFRAFAIFN